MNSHFVQAHVQTRNLQNLQNQQASIAVSLKRITWWSRWVRLASGESPLGTKFIWPPEDSNLSLNLSLNSKNFKAHNAMELLHRSSSCSHHHRAITAHFNLCIIYIFFKSLLIIANKNADLIGGSLTRLMIFVLHTSVWSHCSVPVVVGEQILFKWEN